MITVGEAPPRPYETDRSGGSRLTPRIRQIRGSCLAPTKPIDPCRGVTL